MHNHFGRFIFFLEIMLSPQHIHQLQTTIRKYLPEKSIKIFIFGSSLKKSKFRDVDVGIIGKFPQKTYDNLQEELEESTFPYIVDLVDFNKVDKDFASFVLDKEEKTWL